ncbi:MAG: DUF3857 domain-containing protein [Myxococcales bacterium]|nr:DUF3857 domain-containing protein [Myxococcales bacterium]
MRALVPLLLLSACASSFPKLDLAALPKSADFPDAKHLVLLDEEHVRFEPGKDGKAQAVITERWRAKVLKPTDLPGLTVFYDSEFTEVVSLAGRSLSPEGVEKPLDVSKAFDRPSIDSSVLFSSTRVRSVGAPAVPVGGVFETEVTTRQRDVEPWVLRHVFAADVPVVQSRVVVDVPTGWKLRWSGQSLDGPVTFEPKREELAGGYTRFVFEEKNVPAPLSESAAPPLFLRARRLALRLDAWTENGIARQAPESPEALSRWRWDRYRERAELTPELEAASREVLQGVADEPAAKAKALYEYVCRRIQYCAVEVGYGGWIPHAAKDVHAQRWGDCKDKATYLHALLKAAGIDSSPTVIYSHQGWPRPFELPSLGANFNHVILAVHLPQGTVYADPTTRAVPFGALPWNDAEATVLEVSEKGTPLKQTAPSRAEDNVEKHRLELTLDPHGDAAGRFVIESTGDHATGVKMRAIEGTGRLEQWATDRLWLKSAEVTKVSLDKAEDFGAGSIVSGEVKARRVFARGLGTTGLLRVTEFLDANHVVLAEDRSTPWAARFRSTRETEVVLTLPAGVQPSALPQDTVITSPFGEYALRWKLDGGRLLVTRRFRLDQRVIEVKDVKASRAFHHQVNLAEYAPVVLRFEGAAR